MTQYNFDNIIDRHGTSAVKIDRLDAVFGRHDLTPLWIADLDFAVCPEITAALSRRLAHPVLGYSEASESYWQAIIDWNLRRHGFSIARNELAFVPGVVKGIALAVNFFTREGDGVVIQPPVYTPFRTVVEGNNRKVIENPLIFDGESYSMDLDGLRSVVAEHKPKMMVLCNPHNPIGIQWDADTLAELAAIAREAGMVVVSDEIHGDLMLGGRRHIPFLSAGPDAVAVGIMLGAPSKTFNIPGLVSSWMVVKNPEMRERYYKWLEVNEFSAPVMISTIGAEAAYNNGEEWLDQMLAYVEGNIDFVIDFAARRIPGLKVIRPQASFLLWLDFRGLHLCHREVMDMLLDKAHLALNDGTMFGAQGDGFARLNAGTPRAVLAHALESLETAVCTVCKQS
ncbi:MAG: pyridoxal phosphate-dependent aminotransferase [Muribaculaceae bacterium]|jgi:cystathionine beta-lyase|nr:pyridoxal phosphate-dependent aminotransferase [Muribaculaceae bacterium]GFI12485.1 cystathionine beta-lyase PatB [Muribaculaceae bacterium]